MDSTVIRLENVSKQYRLGIIGTNTLKDDILQWWCRVNGTTDSAFSKNKDHIWALKGINLEVMQGDIVGIIGKNGAGKSTLLKLLSRVTAPTSCEIKIKGRIASLLEVGTGFHPELTGRENIYLNGAILGMKKAEIRRKLDEVISFAGVETFIDTPVKRYSSGMYVRLAFSVAAHLEPDILIVDEVLSVGDAEFQKKAIGKMQDVSSKEGRTVLFVSHNFIAVQQLCKSGLVMNNGEVNFNGNVTDALKVYLNDGQSLARSVEICDRQDRIGSMWFKFMKVEILNSQYELIKKALCGQDIYIRLYYASKKELTNANVLVSFNVRNSQGFLLTNFNSVDSGHHKQSIYYNGYFECYWPKLNIKSDAYDCNLYCSINDEIVDWMQNAFILEVEDGDFFNSGKMIGNQQGPLLIKHTWMGKRF